jgi:hypothetical protein
MNDRPPLRASAIANPSSETDCMIAETNGMFSEILGSSPLLNFTNGVFNDTFCGVHSLVVRPGINRYSPKVRETFSII